MRLTILQDHLRLGGTERQTLHLAERAAASGHTVTLVLFRPGGALFEQTQGSGYTTVVLQGHDTRISLWAPGLKHAIGRSRPDLVLCMGRTANCYAGWLQERHPSWPVVGSLRTGKSLFPWHQWSLGHLRGVLVNCDWWRRRLRSEGAIGDALEVVPNAHLGDVGSSQTRAAVRAELGVGPDTVVLLSVAGFRRGKGQRHLVEWAAALAARSDLPPWELWLVGDGPRRGVCEQRAAELGVADRVRFWGARSDADRFRAAGDIGLSASREDSLPNALIEAQWSGLPIVAWDYRGVGEAFAPGTSGVLLPPGDAVAAVAAVARLIADRVGRDQMGEKAQQWARNRFSSERQGAQLLQILEEWSRDRGDPTPSNLPE